jgi:glycerophosphoryl diester phosphodiesterase
MPKRKGAAIMNVQKMKKYVLVIILTVTMLMMPGAAAAAPLSPSSSHTNPWLNRRVLNIAHQGGEFEAPSDTMFAFKTAEAKGVDMLELDVHATADGEIVAMHDSTVDRTTNGTGRVDQMTLAQIKSLDAAYWFAPNCGTCHGRPATDYSYRGIATGQRPVPPELSTFTPDDFKIPTLREILQQFPDALINIEIKSTVPDTSPYEATVASLLREFGRDSDTIVASFNDVAMTLFKLNPSAVSTSPGIITTGLFWASTQGNFPGMPLPGYQALQVPITYEGLTIVTPSFVTKAHNNGLAVHVWTIDDRNEMERLIDIGVDGIMTSRPSVLKQVLEEKGVGVQD